MTQKKKLTRNEKMEYTKKGICWKCKNKLEKREKESVCENCKISIERF